MRKIKELRKVTRLSYSALHILTCPYAYFLRYQAGIKTPQNEYSARGTALHTALELEHSHGNFNLDSAVKIFKGEFKKIVDEDDIFINWPRYKKMESDAISYLEKYSDDLEEGKFPAPTFVEEEFMIPFEDFEIVGKLDVTELDVESNEIVVVDYKSGSVKPDLWFLDHNLQFTVYSWAILEKYGRLPSKLIWHHLKTGERFETKRTLQDIDDLKQMIRNAIKMNKEGIRHRVFHEQVCNNCDYSGTKGRQDAICDDRELERELTSSLQESKQV